MAQSYAIKFCFDSPLLIHCTCSSGIWIFGLAAKLLSWTNQWKGIKQQSVEKSLTKFRIGLLSLHKYALGVLRPSRCGYRPPPILTHIRLSTTIRLKKKGTPTSWGSWAPVHPTWAPDCVLAWWSSSQSSTRPRNLELCSTRYNICLHSSSHQNKLERCSHKHLPYSQTRQINIRKEQGAICLLGPGVVVFPYSCREIDLRCPQF